VPETELLSAATLLCGLPSRGTSDTKVSVLTVSLAMDEAM
jgi:hypothetical protein